MKLTCCCIIWFVWIFGIFLIPPEPIMKLEEEDSLDNSDTVSLNAESLSGLSVLGSLFIPSWTLPPQPLLSEDEDIVDIVVFVTPDIVEFVRLCVRPCLKSPLCSNILNSPRIASNSASWVSSKFAMENLYESVRSDDVWLLGRRRGLANAEGLDTSNPYK